MLSLLLSANLMVVLLLLQLLYVQRTRAKEICCETTGCFDDLEPFDSMPLPECTEAGKDVPVFKLYTREDWYTAHIITPTIIPEIYSPERPTTIIAHGWITKGETSWVLNMKDELMKKSDVNVVVIDWNMMASNLWYPQSASNVRTVGTHTALIINAIRAYSTKPTYIWCIGHSLGAHLCAHAGVTTKVDRITGMDPAGPWFASNKDIKIGLHPGSAEFVDVMHTDSTFGTKRRLGHLDFYPNKGDKQPGCLTHTCSHNLVPLFFIESIKKDCFISLQTCENHEQIPKSCQVCKGCALMGYGANRSKVSSGVIYLETKGRRPYCLGRSVNLNSLFKN